jgi:hypothetical protein
MTDLPWQKATDHLADLADAIECASSIVEAREHALKTVDDMRQEMRAGFIEAVVVEDRIAEALCHAGFDDDAIMKAVAAKLADDQFSSQAKPNSNANGKTGGNANRFNWRDHVYTAAELQHKTFPPARYCVPDLIPEGLTIIAGKPKIGKSWLALDICIAIAAGRYCLGERKPASGDVLYAAMEDNPRRIQRRMDKLLSTFKEQWPQRLTLANSWRRLDKGGVGDVAQWIETTAKPAACHSGYTRQRQTNPDPARIQRGLRKPRRAASPRQ